MDQSLENLEKDLEAAYDAYEDAQPTGYSGPPTSSSSLPPDSFPATQPSSPPASPEMPASPPMALPNLAAQALEPDAVPSGQAALPASHAMSPEVQTLGGASKALDLEAPEPAARNAPNPDAEARLTAAFEPSLQTVIGGEKDLDTTDLHKPAEAVRDDDDDDEYAPLVQPAPLPTQAAINQRVRRLTKPRADGSCPMPACFMEQWKDIKGGGRDSVLHLFEKCNYEIDRAFCGACLTAKLAP